MATYTDLDSFLKITPNGTVKTTTNYDCIVQSIKTILATVSGERVRNPIGSSLIGVLFEGISGDAAALIKNIIERDIGRYEPRASIQEIKVTPLYDINEYDLKIRFSVLGGEQVNSFDTRLKSLQDY